MTENIVEQERFLDRRPVWHRLGNQYEGKVLPSDVIQNTNLDYELEKQELYFDGGNEFISTGKYAIVKKDGTNQMLGNVSENYAIIQNRELAEIADPIAEEWNLDTIGSAKNGSTIFMTFSGGSSYVQGVDKINNYFMLVNPQNGRESLKMLYTPVRVACQNVLLTAIKNATMKISI